MAYANEQPEHRDIWVDGIKPNPFSRLFDLHRGVSALSYQAYHAFKIWGTDYGHVLPKVCDIR
jgi:hypothetical protein